MTYNDYPKTAIDNSKKVLDWKSKYKDKIDGMSSIDWISNNQIAKGESLSRFVIEKIANLDKLLPEYKKAIIKSEYIIEPWTSPVIVKFLAFGGKDMISWAKEKLGEIENNIQKSLEDNIINIEDIIEKARGRKSQAEIKSAAAEQSETNQLAKILAKNEQKTESTPQQIFSETFKNLPDSQDGFVKNTNESKKLLNFAGLFSGKENAHIGDNGFQDSLEMLKKIYGDNKGQELIDLLDSPKAFVQKVKDFDIKGFHKNNSFGDEPAKTDQETISEPIKSKQLPPKNSYNWRKENFTNKFEKDAVKDPELIKKLNGAKNFREVNKLLYDYHAEKTKGVEHEHANNPEKQVDILDNALKKIDQIGLNYHGQSRREIEQLYPELRNIDDESKYKDKIRDLRGEQNKKTLNENISKPINTEKVVNENKNDESFNKEDLSFLRKMKSDIENKVSISKDDAERLKKITPNVHERNEFTNKVEPLVHINKKISDLESKSDKNTFDVSHLVNPKNGFFNENTRNLLDKVADKYHVRSFSRNEYNKVLSELKYLVGNDHYGELISSLGDKNKFENYLKNNLIDFKNKPSSDENGPVSYKTINKRETENYNGHVKEVKNTYIDGDININKDKNGNYRWKEAGGHFDLSKYKDYIYNKDLQEKLNKEANTAEKAKQILENYSKNNPIPLKPIPTHLREKENERKIKEINKKPVTYTENGRIKVNKNADGIYRWREDLDKLGINRHDPVLTENKELTNLLDKEGDSKSKIHQLIYEHAKNNPLKEFTKKEKIKYAKDFNNNDEYKDYVNSKLKFLKDSLENIERNGNSLDFEHFNGSKRRQLENLLPQLQEITDPDRYRSEIRKLSYHLKNSLNSAITGKEEVPYTKLTRAQENAELQALQEDRERKKKKIDYLSGRESKTSTHIKPQSSIGEQVEMKNAKDKPISEMSFDERLENFSNFLKQHEINNVDDFKKWIKEYKGSDYKLKDGFHRVTKADKYFPHIAEIGDSKNDEKDYLKKVKNLIKLATENIKDDPTLEREIEDLIQTDAGKFEYSRGVRNGKDWETSKERIARLKENQEKFERENVDTKPNSTSFERDKLLEERHPELSEIKDFNSYNKKIKEIISNYEKEAEQRKKSQQGKGGTKSTTEEYSELPLSDIQRQRDAEHEAKYGKKQVEHLKNDYNNDDIDFRNIKEGIVKKYNHNPILTSLNGPDGKLDPRIREVMDVFSKVYKIAPLSKYADASDAYKLISDTVKDKSQLANLKIDLSKPLNFINRLSDINRDLFERDPKEPFKTIRKEESTNGDKDKLFLLNSEGLLTNSGKMFIQKQNDELGLGLTIPGLGKNNKQNSAELIRNFYQKMQSHPEVDTSNIHEFTNDIGNKFQLTDDEGRLTKVGRQIIEETSKKLGLDLENDPNLNSKVEDNPIVDAFLDSVKEKIPDIDLDNPTNFMSDVEKHEKELKENPEVKNEEVTEKEEDQKAAINPNTGKPYRKRANGKVITEPLQGKTDTEQTTDKQKEIDNISKPIGEKENVSEETKPVEEKDNIGVEKPVEEPSNAEETKNVEDEKNTEEPNKTEEIKPTEVEKPVEDVKNDEKEIVQENKPEVEPDQEVKQTGNQEQNNKEELQEPKNNYIESTSTENKNNEINDEGEKQDIEEKPKEDTTNTQNKIVEDKPVLEDKQTSIDKISEPIGVKNESEVPEVNSDTKGEPQLEETGDGKIENLKDSEKEQTEDVPEDNVKNDIDTISEPIKVAKKKKDYNKLNLANAAGRLSNEGEKLIRETSMKLGLGLENDPNLKSRKNNNPLVQQFQDLIAEKFPDISFESPMDFIAGVGKNSKKIKEQNPPKLNLEDENNTPEQTTSENSQSTDNTGNTTNQVETSNEETKPVETEKTTEDEKTSVENENPTGETGNTSSTQEVSSDSSDTKPIEEKQDSIDKISQPISPANYSKIGSFKNQNGERVHIYGNEKDDTLKWLNDEGKELSEEESKKANDFLNEKADKVRSKLNDFKYKISSGKDRNGKNVNLYKNPDYENGKSKDKYLWKYDDGTLLNNDEIEDVKNFTGEKSSKNVGIDQDSNKKESVFDKIKNKISGAKDNLKNALNEKTIIPNDKNKENKKEGIFDKIKNKISDVKDNLKNALNEKVIKPTQKFIDQNSEDDDKNFKEIDEKDKKIDQESEQKEPEFLEPPVQKEQKTDEVNTEEKIPEQQQEVKQEEQPIVENKKEEEEQQDNKYDDEDKIPDDYTKDTRSDKDVEKETREALEEQRQEKQGSKQGVEPNKPMKVEPDLKQPGSPIETPKEELPIKTTSNLPEDIQNQLQAQRELQERKRKEAEARGEVYEEQPLVATETPNTMRSQESKLGIFKQPKLQIKGDYTNSQGEAVSSTVDENGNNIVTPQQGQQQPQKLGSNTNTPPIQEAAPVKSTKVEEMQGPAMTGEGSIKNNPKLTPIKVLVTRSDGTTFTKTVYKNMNPKQEVGQDEIKENKVPLKSPTENVQSEPEPVEYKKIRDVHDVSVGDKVHYTPEGEIDEHEGEIASIERDVQHTPHYGSNYDYYDSPQKPTITHLVNIADHNGNVHTRKLDSNISIVNSEKQKTFNQSIQKAKEKGVRFYGNTNDPNVDYKFDMSTFTNDLKDMGKYDDTFSNSEHHFPEQVSVIKQDYSNGKSGLLVDCGFNSPVKEFKIQGDKNNAALFITKQTPNKTANERIDFIKALDKQVDKGKGIKSITIVGGSSTPKDFYTDTTMGFKYSPEHLFHKFDEALNKKSKNGDPYLLGKIVNVEDSNGETKRVFLSKEHVQRCKDKFENVLKSQVKPYLKEGQTFDPNKQRVNIPGGLNFTSMTIGNNGQSEDLIFKAICENTSNWSGDEPHEADMHINSKDTNSRIYRQNFFNNHTKKEEYKIARENMRKNDISHLSTEYPREYKEKEKNRMLADKNKRR